MRASQPRIPSGLTPPSATFGFVGAPLPAIGIAGRSGRRRRNVGERGVAARLSFPSSPTRDGTRDRHAL